MDATEQTSWELFDTPVPEGEYTALVNADGHVVLTKIKRYPNTARLSVNVSLENMTRLRRWSAFRNVNLTNGVGIALSVWDMLMSEQIKGSTFSIIDKKGRIEHFKLKDDSQ